MHTPGPWDAVIYPGPWDHPRVTWGGGTLALVTSQENRMHESNAHLIAAAPDLLTSLEKAVEHYGKPGGPWNVPSEPGTWIADARAAIAKAKGET